MYCFRTTSFYRIIFPKIIYKLKTPKTLYLTFDDCKSYECTMFVLELLGKWNIKATFFCTGKYVENNNLITQILSEGHSVGNHSYNHLNAWKFSSKFFCDDVLSFDNIYKSKIFRPPYGKLKPNDYFILSKNYKIVYWDLLTYDFDENINHTLLFELVKQKVRDGDIIVFHTNNNTFQKLKIALPLIIEYLSEKFIFEKII